MRPSESERLELLLSVSEKQHKLIISILRQHIIYLDTSWNYVQQTNPQLYAEANVAEFRQRTLYLLNEVLKTYETNN
jgi:hypothetical protein